MSLRVLARLRPGGPYLRGGHGASVSKPGSAVHSPEACSSLCSPVFRTRKLEGVRKGVLPRTPSKERIPFLACDLACLVCTVQIKLIIKLELSQPNLQEFAAGVPTVPAKRTITPGPRAEGKIYSQEH